MIRVFRLSSFNVDDFILIKLIYKDNLIAFGKIMETIATNSNTLSIESHNKLTKNFVQLFVTADVESSTNN